MRGRLVVWGGEVVRANSRASGRDNSWHNGRDNSGENLEKRNNESDRVYGRKSDGRGHFGSRYMNACYRGEAWQTIKIKETGEEGRGRALPNLWLHSDGTPCVIVVQ